jgi:hypothetical protein
VAAEADLSVREPIPTPASPPSAAPAPKKSSKAVTTDFFYYHDDYHSLIIVMEGLKDIWTQAKGEANTHYQTTKADMKTAYHGYATTTELSDICMINDWLLLLIIELNKMSKTVSLMHMQQLNDIVIKHVQNGRQHKRGLIGIYNMKLRYYNAILNDYAPILLVCIYSTFFFS